MGGTRQYIVPQLGKGLHSTFKEAPAYPSYHAMGTVEQLHGTALSWRDAQCEHERSVLQQPTHGSLIQLHQAHLSTVSQLITTTITMLQPSPSQEMTVQVLVESLSNVVSIVAPTLLVLQATTWVIA